VATVSIVVVDAGVCGLSAAPAPSEAGAEALVLERNGSIIGSKAMSTGLIPAAGTRSRRKQAQATAEH